jgi:hypothetical protein
MGDTLMRVVIERHAKRLRNKAKLVTIDLDPTDYPTHGAQQLTFFNAFYDAHCKELKQALQIDRTNWYSTDRIGSPHYPEFTAFFSATAIVLRYCQSTRLRHVAAASRFPFGCKGRTMSASFTRGRKKQKIQPLYPSALIMP